MVQGYLDCLMVICGYVSSPMWPKHQSHPPSPPTLSPHQGPLFCIISVGHPPSTPTHCGLLLSACHLELLGKIVTSTEHESLQDISKGVTVGQVPLPFTAHHVFRRLPLGKFVWMFEHFSEWLEEPQRIERENCELLSTVITVFMIQGKSRRRSWALHGGPLGVKPVPSSGFALPHVSLCRPVLCITSPSNRTPSPTVLFPTSLCLEQVPLSDLTFCDYDQRLGASQWESYENTEIGPG